MMISRLTHAQRNRLLEDSFNSRTEAERETARRISAFYREAYPMPWDDELAAIEAEEQA